MLGLHLDVVEQAVDLEDLDGMVDLGQDARAQATRDRARERLPAEAARGRREVAFQSLLQRHARFHAGSMAQRIAPAQRVGWWDHPFGR